MIVIEVIVHWGLLVVSGDGDLRPRLQAPWQRCLGSKKTAVEKAINPWAKKGCYPKRVGWFVGLFCCLVWVGFVWFMGILATPPKATPQEIAGLMIRAY